MHALQKDTLYNTTDLELHKIITRQQQQARQRTVVAPVCQNCAPQVSAAAPGGSRPRDPTLPRFAAGLNQICARNSNLLASTRHNITIFW